MNGPPHTRRDPYRESDDLHIAYGVDRENEDQVVESPTDQANIPAEEPTE